MNDARAGAAGLRRSAGMIGRVKRLISRLQERAFPRSHAVLFVVPGGSGGFSPINPRLYRERPAFRESIDSTGAIVGEVLGWNAIGAFRGSKERSAVRETERRNELAYHGIARIALIDQWRSEGVTADAAVGISLGEVIAPYATGAISRDECALLVASLAEAVNGPASDHRVYVIRGSAAEVMSLCFDAPASVDFLGASSPALSLVVFSETERTILQEYFGERIVTEAATGWRYHTPDMHFGRSWTREQIGEGIALRPTGRPIYSSAVGGRLPSETILDARTIHWIMGSPSHFAEAVSTALQDGFDVAVQVSPTPHRIFADVTQTAESERRRVRQYVSLDGEAEVRRMRRRPVHAADALAPAEPELDAAWWDEVGGTHDRAIASVSERFLAPLVDGKPFDVVSAFADPVAREYAADRPVLRQLLTSSVLALLRDDALRRRAISLAERSGSNDDAQPRASLADAPDRSRAVALAALRTLLRVVPDFAVFQPLNTVHRVKGAIERLVIAR